MDKPAERTSASGATSQLTDPIKGSDATDPEEFARAIAEIEHASAALRKAEPALESWAKAPTKRFQSRRPKSIWLLVATLWLSTGLIMAGVVTAVAYFVR